MVGITPTSEALQLAFSKELDLVKISSNTIPPVCKITDYNKEMYERTKKEKDAKKKQKIVLLKEVRLSIKIESHDFDFKVKNAIKFLNEGHKVKANIRFRGRQQKSYLLGSEMLIRFATALKDVGTIEKHPFSEGKNMSMIMIAKKQ